MKPQKESIYPTIAIGEYRIAHKFREYGIIPHEMIDKAYWNVVCKNNADLKLWNDAIFTTSDNVKVRIEFIATYNNSDGTCDDQINTITNELYSLSFNAAKEVAKKRVGHISGWWSKIRMVKV